MKLKVSGAAVAVACDANLRRWLRQLQARRHSGCRRTPDRLEKGIIAYGDNRASEGRKDGVAAAA